MIIIRGMSDPTGFLVEASGVNFAVTEETSFNSKTPPVTGWHNAQINSYASIGADFKKTPRNPISQSLQLQKGMLTDEDSGIGINTDITKDSLDRWAKGTFRSIRKDNGNKQTASYAVRGVTSTGFTVDALGDLAQRMLIVARGLGVDGNNGLKMIGAGSTNTEAKTTGLAIEASPPANAVIELAGYRGATGDLSLDADGNLVSGGLVDFTSFHLLDFQWVWVGGVVGSAFAFSNPDFTGAARIARNGVTTNKITFDQRSWSVQEFSYLDLATKTTNVDSVVEARTAGPAGDSITIAFVGDGDPAVKASLALNGGGKTVHVNTVVQAKQAGIAGNNITIEFVAGAGAAAGTITEVGTNVKITYKATATASKVSDIEALIATSSLIEVKTAGTSGTSLDGTDVMSSTPLAGGVAADDVTVTEVSNAVTVHYSPSFSTVAEIEDAITSDSTKIQVKTPGTPTHLAAATVDAFTATNLAHGASGADAGTGKTIDVYFTGVYRNVARNHPDFAKVSYVMEVVHPELYNPADGYQYPRGNAIDTTVFNFPTTSKATMDITFMGTTTPDPTQTRKTGPANALDPVTNVGVSTATDLAYIRFSDTNDVGVGIDVESLKVTIKNNVTMQKKLGLLGGYAIINGQTEWTVEGSFVFTTPESIAAVRDNRTCRGSVLSRNEDFGAMLSIEAMTLDSAGLKIELNKAVTLDSKGTGFQNLISGATGSLSMFAYLPPANIDAE